GSLTHDVIAKHSSKNLSKGVMVTVEGKNVSVQISLIIEYGCSVPVVTAKVQERVKSAIENMTGLEVTEVKITVAGVNM
ncbi:MAG: Asp23/Gls24 family envelope stress response protein, partial [Lachnospiraceae bacterium]